jgi:hypothetical protein
MMSSAPWSLQRLDQLRRQGLVPGRLAGDADHVHVVVDGVLRGLFRGLEQRAHIHVEADIGKGRGDHLGAPVVPVLAHLDHQHARAPALRLGEGLDVLLDRGEALVALVGRAVDPGERLHLGPVTAEHLFHRHRNLSHRGPRPRRLDRQFQQVALARRAVFQRLQRRVAGGLVAARADLFQPRDLAVAHRDVVDIEDVDLVLLGPELVDADDHLVAPVDRGLPRAAASSIRSFGMPEATALVMPPISSTSWISSQAFIGQIRGQLST